MNLKRLRGIVAVALATIAAAMFAGCSNSLAGSIDESAVGGSNARMATLSLSATGIPNEYAEQFARSYPNASARSITPNNPYDVSTEGLTFKLSGKSEAGKVQPEMEVKLVAKTSAETDDDTGTAVYVFDDDVVLDAMSWNLKLVAYNADGGAVLQGFCTVDLRTGSGEAKFVMGTAGLDTKGSVKISGKFVDKDDAAASYSMGIYRKDTGELLLPIQTGACNVEKVDEEFEFKAEDNVPPGTYLYTMIFYQGANCTGTIVGSFTDTLVVDPGNALERTLYIDVIGRNPVAPTDLKAYLVNGSEGKNGNPTYNVKVEWKKSAYATNYELQVLEYKGDDTDASFVIGYDTNDNAKLDTASANNWTATTYGMSSMDTETPKTVQDFAGSAVYGTGDGASYMMFGDTSCILSLETGKIYEIRLRGRNYIGVSAFAEREASSDDANSKLTGFAVDVDKKDHINRLLVTYHLNGGTLTRNANGDNSAKTYTNVFAEYKSWTPTFAATTTNTALVENGTTYKIINNTSDFDKWLFEKGEGLQIDNTNNKTINSSTANASKEKVTNFTYKNLTVIANYGNKVEGNISMEESLKDIDLAKIKVTFNGTELSAIPLGTAGTDVVLNKYVIDKVADDETGTTKNELKVSLDENDTEKYTDVSFTLTYGQNNEITFNPDSGADRTCTFDITSYPVGSKIQVRISAVTNRRTTMSQTLIFELR